MEFYKASEYFDVGIWVIASRLVPSLL